MTLTANRPSVRVVSASGLYDDSVAGGMKADFIGDAFEASVLDAKRFIKRATELSVAD
ncbi:MAG: hypothetical protein ABL973_09340 [Micropepsaceae bacterium]